AYAVAADAPVRWWRLAGEPLSLSSICYMEAGAPEQAVGVLRRYLALALKPEDAGEAYLRLGEALRQLNRRDEADDAYRHSLSYQECGAWYRGYGFRVRTRFAFQARNRLAESAIAQGRLDEAEELLTKNVHLLRFIPEATEAKETALFTLGELYYRQTAYRKV